MTEQNDFAPYSHGWWVYYGTFRATGQQAFLFNVKADTKYEAIRKGQNIYQAMDPDNVVRRLYSLDNHTARPLNREQADLLESKEMGR